MGLFERYLSIWITISIVTGIVIGSSVPCIFTFISAVELFHVNIVIAILIWLMIYPMMSQVDLSAIKGVGQNSRGLILTLIFNWLIKPFTMAGLGWIFLKIVFSPWVDIQSANEYISGMILLGVAPCTAMVFIWSQLTDGDPNYTLVQVSVNDIIMVFAFAPIAAFLLGVNNVHVPWDTLVMSVILYVIVPLILGIITRYKLKGNTNNLSLENFLNKIKPWSVVGLILTVCILFGLQAEAVVEKPYTILLIAVPLILQTYGIFIVSYSMARVIKLQHNIGAPACLIATSNFFELAVAVAISMFGLHSGAALATIVGVLVEVPVMLSLVYVTNKTKFAFNH